MCSQLVHSTNDDVSDEFPNPHLNSGGQFCDQRQGGIDVPSVGKVDNHHLWNSDDPEISGKLRCKTSENIWGWVKTLVPSEPQNSWDLWMFIPLKMYL